MPLVEKLKSILCNRGNPEIALQQSAYVKNRFEFYGLKAPERRNLYNPFLTHKNLPEKEEAFRIISNLYHEPQRELHYFAMEIMFKYHKQKPFLFGQAIDMI